MLMIVINGEAGVGKDTFIKHIRDNSKLNIKNISTIDPIKQVLYCLGWDGIKTEKNRMMLAEMKKIWIKYFNGCFEFTKNIYNENKDDYDIIFLHCREPEEIEKIVNGLDNVETLLIKNNTGRSKSYKNGADDVVYDYSYTYTINNNGSINDLKKEAIKFVNMFNIK